MLISVPGKLAVSVRDFFEPCIPTSLANRYACSQVYIVRTLEPGIVCLVGHSQQQSHGKIKILYRSPVGVLSAGITFLFVLRVIHNLLDGQ